MRSTSGMTCCHFFCSVVFSMPVCRYPIVGLAERTISPSSSSTRRSTPCVLGCCGPMLTVIVSVRISATRQSILLHVCPELGFGHLERFGRLRRLPDLDRIVLPKRIAVPILGHQQAARIGMTVERDAEKIPDLALEPVRRGPQIADRRHVRIVAVQAHLQAEALPVGDRHEEVDQLEARLSRPE